MQCDDPIPQDCKFVREEDIASGKWIKLTNITYTDPHGKERLWETVKRTTKVSSDKPDAIVSIPWFRRKGQPARLVLVKQYRPPIHKYSLEFPAGLLDPKESAETCALRELKEETGYIGTATHTSAATSLDPGIVGTTAQIVTVEIDGDLPENQNPKPHLEETEFIEVLTVPAATFLEELDKLTGPDVMVDSRLYSFALGLHQAQHILTP